MSNPQNYAHYRVRSEELDEECIVFNATSDEQAREQSLNQVFGERLDRLYDGDANSHPGYDETEDLSVEVICGNNVLMALPIS